MRYLTLIILLPAFTLQSLGQTTIQIIVKDNKNHKINKVDVFDLSQKEFFETPYKDTLNFTFNKQNIDCYNIRYHDNGKMYRQQIWLNTGRIKIEAHIHLSQLIIDSVYNSPAYYEHLNLTKNYLLLLEKNDTTIVNNWLLENYLHNIENPYSFVFADRYIQLNQNSKANLSKLKILTDKQGDRFNWFLLYPSVVKRLNNILTVSSINVADYSFIDRHNKEVKLLALNKKYYILDFWFLGCAPCIRDHKEIMKELKTLDDKNAEVISISTDNDSASRKWKAYLTKNKYNWQNYRENNTKTITEQFKISIFPTYIIIDKSGNILYTQNSFSNIISWLNNK